ncbi:uncharacterized protein G2W53_012664 [Senna tora]|uniref:Uncharacterized protein n=1 Tax=Senna tora TaxID=362788 RepID=A0A834WRX3_9FABA|nr:uncharacterized protein G2W53_012664 [Senna tora]
MMVKEDEWVAAALTDDMVVVDLLIRLKQSQAVSISARPKSQPLPPALGSLTWGLKQPRSKVKSSSHSHHHAAFRRKDDDFTRFSPTTPLSWSGGASPSATADGYEDSTLPTILSQHAAGFKVTPTSEYTSSNSASTKRCKRKKTYAELKEEESSLLKERTFLKREIANLNTTFRAQRAKNESLKRIKIDLGSKSENDGSSTCDEELRTLCGQPHQRIAQESRDASEDDSHTDTDTEVAAADSSNARKAESMGESFFLIPDLNVMPSEEDSYSDALCGMI